MDTPAYRELRPASLLMLVFVLVGLMVFATLMGRVMAPNVASWQEGPVRAQDEALAADRARLIGEARWDLQAIAITEQPAR